MLKSKELLRQIRTETTELRCLQLKRDWLYSTLLPKGITYKSVDVQESGLSDQMAERFGEIYELEKVIENRAQALVRKHLQAEILISKLTDAKYRCLLGLYYLSEKRTTWQQVADEMGYSEREIYNIHGNALQQLEIIIKIYTS